MHPSDKKQYWTHLIQQQADSTLSATEFCKDNHIARHNFYYWRKKLGHNSQAVIHPVVIDDTDFLSSTVVSVALPNGIRAEFPIQVSPTQLQHWLKALQC